MGVEQEPRQDPAGISEHDEVTERWLSVLDAKGTGRSVSGLAEERYPVYLLYPSRQLAPAKLRAVAEFLISSTR